MNEFLSELRQSIEKFGKTELVKICSGKGVIPVDFISEVEKNLGIINLSDIVDRKDFYPAVSIIVSTFSYYCVELAFLFAQHYAFSDVVGEKSKLYDGFYAGFLPLSEKEEIFYVKNKKSLTGISDMIIGSGYADTYILRVVDEDEINYIIKARGKLSFKETVDFMIGFEKIPLRKISFTNSEIERFKVYPAKKFEYLYKNILENMFVNLIPLFSGILKKAYELSFNYSNERKQGGVEIIKHPPVANMLRKIENTAAQLEALSIYFQTTKRNSDKIFFSVIDSVETSLIDSIQVLGGYGYMEEFGLEKLLRDFRTVKSLFSDFTG